MERDRNGKFVSSECWEELERGETLRRMAQGWERSLERLKSEVEKLRNRRIPHGRYPKGDD